MSPGLRLGQRLLGVRCAAALLVGHQLHRSPLGKSEGHHTVLGAQRSLGDEGRGPSGAPLLRFGVIADIQYCDIADATNFANTETRRYRGALVGAAGAVAAFNEAKVAFVAQLGDLIDGQNSGAYGAGLAWKDAPRSEKALGQVLKVLDASSAPMVHAVGNHELYNFGARAMEQTDGPLNQLGRHTSAVAGKCYFEMRGVARGWTVVMLNPYEESVMQPPDSEGYAAAARQLREHNPNDVLGEGYVDFFGGMSGEQLRFVPFNGACGPAQREWLRATLADCHARDEKVVLLSHLPLHHAAASWRNVAFDAPEVLNVIHESEAQVVCVLAGHCHCGGYVADERGVHHVTVQAQLTHETAHGIVELFQDSIRIRGSGSLPSRTLRREKTAKIAVA